MSKAKQLKVSEMTGDQLECYGLLCCLFRGEHHFSSVYECGRTGLRCSVYQSMATWDFNTLTRLVILCHDMCIRGEVHQGAPRSVGLSLWKRKGRTGVMYDRHPTLKEAIAMCRQGVEVEE